MNDKKIQVELLNKEKKLGVIYPKYVNIFLLLTILFIIIAAVDFIGIFVFGAGYNWALLSIDVWLILFNIIMVIFILLIIYFFIHLNSIQRKRKTIEKPKPEFINGKRVYILTFPTGMEGGIFSKTYIEIDKHSILRLRTLIIPPSDLL